MKIHFGKVYLVGAGPADPGLITVRAQSLLRRADVIFYDNLVNPLLLKNAKPGAECIDVGKRGEGSSAHQREIEDKIVEKARLGKCVVRLKGGDPFIFGRGGEEAERLASEKIPFEIVPGVSSAIAVPAYAGIPLSHRDFTKTITFVTGHPKTENTQKNDHPIDWQALAQMGTIVFLMGVKTLEENMNRLMAAGRDPKTPVAVIRWGSDPKQQTYLGEIGAIASQMKAIHLMPPAVIVVGEVVHLREKIAWFESRPLFGKRILVTRAQKDAAALSESLRALGAEVIEIPLIELRPTHSWDEVDQAIENLSSYAWLLFTSAHGVRFFMDRVWEREKDCRVFGLLKIAAVGTSTRESLGKYFLKPDRIPEEFSGKALGEMFEAAEIAGKKILFPAAKDAREELPALLKSKGAFVEKITVYENHVPDNALASLQSLDLSHLNLLTFTSPSTVKHFLDGIPANKKSLAKKLPVVALGSTTQGFLHTQGFQQILPCPSTATTEGMIQTISQIFSHEQMSD